MRSALSDAQAIQLPGVYVERLEELNSEFGHSIVLLEEGRTQIRRFNCFAYALGVWDNPAYQEMVSAHAEDQLALINSALVSKWIAKRFLEEIKPGDARADDIVAYFYRGQLVHFARSGAAGVLRSKWGANEVHAHGIWEVPANYGNKVRYFRRPDTKALLRELASLE
ncbi:DUF7689 domain-containing protein [Bradyrhizobium centrolobii]|uniref:DUF7689 domain-containing protein n=1 Tax=Bradyrhizobium centrolobii TaxID=1505087 RepID=UPI000B275585|nr:hypothetical protein [Bradyrhizobium centrolobii]